ncbi:intraflagellar transport protein 27 homolog [Cimex lectularius]|uniref:Uncharacterized protein n=1 Tax=Cimex lectularius TaxID=79782 RepID=A0A8I6SBG8_CIMLE|nr:intraflagellar transport protein 27 homolog [Cimex lectularius]
MPMRLFRGKLVLIGDAAVGKSAICQTFATDGSEFPKNYNMTLGAEVYQKQIQISGTEDLVELLIYDSPSFEMYIELLDSFWRSPHLLMVVYDVTNKKSLEAVSDWVSTARQVQWQGPNNGPIASVLFANKDDLEQRRQCGENEGLEMAEQYLMKFFTGSAKNNQGLEDPFRYLANAFYQHSITEPPFYE